MSLPEKRHLPAITPEKSNVKKLPTEEPWEVHGYSESIGVSILKKGKVLKISTYQPKQPKQPNHELDRDLAWSKLEEDLIIQGIIQ